MIQSKTVDITPMKITLPVIEMSQYDLGRQVIVHMKDGSDWFDLTGYTAKLQGTKPSGFGYTVDGVVDGHDITFASNYDMTSEAGFIPSEVRLTKDGASLGSLNVILHVEKTPHDVTVTDGSPETIIPEMTELVERAEAAAEVLLDCSAIATTLPAGSSATASYDVDNGVFTFGIPRGNKGETGATGATGNGISSITKTGTSGLVDTYTIYFTDQTTTTFTVTNGRNGTGSVADVWQNGVSVLDGSTAKVTVPTKTSDLTNDSNFVASTSLATVATTGDYDDLIDTPTNVSDFTNDAGYITGYTETDPVFSASAASGITASQISQWNGIAIGDNTEGIIDTITHGYTSLPNNGMATATAVRTNGGNFVGFMYRYGDTYGGGSLVRADNKFCSVFIYNGVVTVVYDGVLVIDVASFSSLPQTVSNSAITANHVCVKAELGTPSAQTGDWTVTTSAGSLTLSGLISGSTTAKLYLAVAQ